ncbi:hypothetical protein E2C01_014638 [Portunus trituberculatus]|uniref:Uncharacterized protein n=1 Tax=Portunus trituberculatus TaxID=210409 RepID=A0A5B7DL31_PORTR|nr:hypothetical protein [Portunus trituberculatus]
MTSILALHYSTTQPLQQDTIPRFRTLHKSTTNSSIPPLYHSSTPLLQHTSPEMKPSTINTQKGMHGDKDLGLTALQN